METLRIFISSPGDVVEEREMAKKVIADLQRQLGDQATLVPILWEELAIPATASFQEGIDFVLAERHRIDIAVFILWARLGSPLGPCITKRDGSAYLSGTEREFDLMLAAFEKSGGKMPVILAYTRDDNDGFNERLDAREHGDDALEELIRQRKRVKRFIRENFQDKEGCNLRAYHSYREPVGFAQRLHVHLRDAVNDLVGFAPPAILWAEAPYRSLEVFDIQHSPIFCGRDEETCELLQRLRDQERTCCAFVCIVGASGSGKSSLARAGVAATLMQRSFDEGVKEWRVATCLPSLSSGDLLLFTAQSLAATIPEVQDGACGIERFAKRLEDNHEAAADLLESAFKTASCKVGGTVRLLLVLDQMEELWTVRSITDERREKFLRAVEALARSGHVSVLATLRSDFYPQAQRSEAFLSMKGERGHFDLTPPSTAALQELIVQPAQRAGFRFEHDTATGRKLEQFILEDAARDPSALPLLQYALAELHERRDEKQRLLTFAAYETMGGVEGALGQRAAQTFESLPSDAQSALDELLSLLVSADIGGEQSAVRRWAPLAELTRTAARRQLTEALIAARFLTTDEQGGTGIASLAHEALLRRWDRLKEWTARNRDLLRLRATVEQGESRWELSGRDPSLLLPSGLPLEEGRQLLCDGGHMLTAEVREYVEVSIKQREAEEARRVKLRRAMIGALGVLTLVALGTAGWAVMKQRKAAAETTRAEAAEKDADTRLRNQLAMAVRSYSSLATIEGPVSGNVIASALEQMPTSSAIGALTLNHIFEPGHHQGRREAVEVIGMLPSGNPFSDDGTKLCVLNPEGNVIKILDYNQLKELEQFDLKSEKLLVFRFLDPTGSNWAAGFESGAVLVRRSGKQPIKLHNPPEAGQDGVADLISSVFSRDLLVLRNSGELSKYDLTSLLVIERTLPMVEKPLTKTGFISREGHYYTVELNGDVRIFRPNDQLIEKFSSLVGQISNDYIDLKGGRIAFITADNESSDSLHLFDSHTHSSAPLPPFSVEKGTEVLGLMPDLPVVLMRNPKGGLGSAELASTRNENEDQLDSYSYANRGVNNRSSFTFSSARVILPAPDALSSFAFAPSTTSSGQKITEFLRWHLSRGAALSTNDTDKFRDSSELGSISAWVTRAVVDRDGRMIVCSCDDGIIRLICTGGRAFRDVPLFAPKSAIYASSFNYLAQAEYSEEKNDGEESSEIRIYDLSQRRLTPSKLKREKSDLRNKDGKSEDYVTSIKFSNSGKMLGVIYGQRDELFIYETTSGNLLGSWKVKFSERTDDSIGREEIDNTARVSEPIYTPEISMFLISDNPKFAIVLSGEGITVIDLDEKAVVKRPIPLPFKIDYFGTTSDQKFIWISNPKEFAVFDKESQSLVYRSPTKDGFGCISFDISIDYRRGALVPQEGELVGFELDSWTTPWTVTRNQKIHAVGASDVLIINDGDIFVHGSKMVGGFRIVDYETMESIEFFEASAEALPALFYPAGVPPIINVSGSGNSIGDNLRSSWPPMIRENPVLLARQTPLPKWFPAYAKELLGISERYFSIGVASPRISRAGSMVPEDAVNDYYAKVCRWMDEDPSTRFVQPSIETPTCDLIEEITIRVLAAGENDPDLAVLSDLAKEAHVSDPSHPLVPLMIARVFDLEVESPARSASSLHANLLRQQSIRLFESSRSSKVYGTDRMKRFSETAIKGLTRENEEGCRDSIRRVSNLLNP